MSAAFALDERLAAASDLLAELALCQVRLHLDARWPWLVLVPQRPGLVEIEQLAPDDRALLWDELTRAGAAVRAMGAALGTRVEKLNVGALGNVVPQLHIHVLGRRDGDANWPGPVWGFGTPEPYTEGDLQRVKAAAVPLLQPS